MRAFVEIVDQGSLTAAGDALDRSLPTMVRTLAQLERELGAVLLRRTTRRMSLTEEGRVYLERCRRILADVAEAEALVGDVRGEPQGPLRVTAPVLFGQRHVAPAVADFLAANPAVQVDLLLLDRVVDLVEEGIDAAVRIAHLADSTMIAVPLGGMRRVLCASPDLLATYGTPDDPEALSALPCVRFFGLSPSSTWRFQRDGQDVAVAVEGSFTTNHVAAAVSACSAGLGFGQFLAYQIAPEVEQGRLEVVLPQHEVPPIPVSLVYAHARLLSPRLRAFVDWMKDRLAF
ncbi:MAG: LysR family transcriptional regulator [Myxococcota bacterium]|nr:LysR family transcriptional regulator [Myxococcota bacterium]